MSGDSRYSPEIHRAAEIVSVQADCELEQAYVLMSDRATVAHRSLDDIAQSVLDHSIRFGPYAN
jgi:AmiR/NasT family two-component response regulator